MWPPCHTKRAVAIVDVFNYDYHRPGLVKIGIIAETLTCEL